MTKALVVLSGGQDSTICLYAAIAEHGRENVASLAFNYGQRHSRELAASAAIAKYAGVQHEVLNIGAILNGRSPLTNADEKLETYKDAASMDKIIGDRVELTFVPMRNDLFLTLAANRAVCMDATLIYTGVCQADNANYPDCRQTFIDAKEDSINEALGFIVDVTSRQIQIVTPLMDMPKNASIHYGLQFPGCYTALGLSHTAYSGEYPPVTQDHATVLRADGFEKAGVPDPLLLRAWMESRIHYPKGSNYEPFGDDLASLANSFTAKAGKGAPTPLEPPYEINQMQDMHGAPWHWTLHDYAGSVVERTLIEFEQAMRDGTFKAAV